MQKSSYISRFMQIPKKSFFLFGPRGTGKSTLLRTLFPNAYYIDLLSPITRFRYSAHPEQLFDIVRALNEGDTIIIDEVQKVPDLLTVVHALIEEKKGWQFILTGSSARKLKKQGVDLLAGRALLKNLHPFMAAELGEDFALDHALKYGMLPLYKDSEEIQNTLETYVSMYIDEEVRQESLVRHFEPFTRFLEVMSFSHGSLLNMTNIARECYVKRTTVHNWLNILEDLMIGYQLDIFTKRSQRALSAHSKFYFFDAGVFHTLRPKSLSDAYTEILGVALEGLVAQHLRAWKEYTQEKHSLHFWRTRSGLEVDFVLLGPLGFWAIEVKNSQNISPRNLSSLKAFKEDYPEAKLLFLYRGDEKRLIDGIQCLPCELFLKNLLPNSALDAAFLKK